MLCKCPKMINKPAYGERKFIAPWKYGHVSDKLKPNNYTVFAETDKQNVLHWVVMCDA